MALLKVEHLHKTFPGGRGREPNKALNDINFEMSGQHFVSVVGPSGCGKSTLLNIVSGVERATSGTVTVVDDEGEPARLGYVFQDPRLLPWRTVMDNMLYVQDDRTSQRREQMVKYLRMVGLDGHTDYFPSQLSGGMQQRVGLARALAVDPEVMFFDEPFSALDPLIRRDMQNEVLRLHHEVGKTMVFITHDLAEALKLGDHIVIMRDGKVVQIGRPEEVVGAPADDYVADFVSDVPRSHVLTLRWIMRPLEATDPTDGPEFDASSVIRNCLEVAASTEKPIRVTQDGTLLGVVDRARILAAVADTIGERLISTMAGTLPAPAAAAVAAADASEAAADVAAAGSGGPSAG
jgi:glycine betaine/proline transport system ATP-binding protein